MSNENIENTPQSIRLKVEELLLAMEARKDLQRQVNDKDARIKELVRIVKRVFDQKSYAIFKARTVDRKTLHEVGTEHGFTRERTRQIEEKIKKRLIRIVYQ